MPSSMRPNNRGASWNLVHAHVQELHTLLGSWFPSNWQDAYGDIKILEGSSNVEHRESDTQSSLRLSSQNTIFDIQHLLDDLSDSEDVVEVATKALAVLEWIANNFPSHRDLLNDLSRIFRRLILSPFPTTVRTAPNKTFSLADSMSMKSIHKSSTSLRLQEDTTESDLSSIIPTFYPFVAMAIHFGQELVTTQKSLAEAQEKLTTTQGSLDEREEQLIHALDRIDLLEKKVLQLREETGSQTRLAGSSQTHGADRTLSRRNAELEARLLELRKTLANLHAEADELRNMRGQSQRNVARFRLTERQRRNDATYIAVSKALETNFPSDLAWQSFRKSHFAKLVSNQSREPTAVTGEAAALQLLDSTTAKESIEDAERIRTMLAETNEKGPSNIMLNELRNAVNELLDEYDQGLSRSLLSIDDTTRTDFASEMEELLLEIRSMHQHVTCTEDEFDEEADPIFAHTNARQKITNRMLYAKNPHHIRPGATVTQSKHRGFTNRQQELYFTPDGGGFFQPWRTNSSSKGKCKEENMKFANNGASFPSIGITDSHTKQPQLHTPKAGVLTNDEIGHTMSVSLKVPTNSQHSNTENDTLNTSSGIYTYVPANIHIPEIDPTHSSEEDSDDDTNNGNSDFIISSRYMSSIMNHEEYNQRLTYLLESMWKNFVEHSCHIPLAPRSIRLDASLSLIQEAMRHKIDLESRESDIRYRAGLWEPLVQQKEAEGGNGKPSNHGVTLSPFSDHFYTFLLTSYGLKETRDSVAYSVLVAISEAPRTPYVEFVIASLAGALEESAWKYYELCLMRLEQQNIHPDVEDAGRIPAALYPAPYTPPIRRWVSEFHSTCDDSESPTEMDLRNFLAVQVMHLPHSEPRISRYMRTLASVPSAGRGFVKFNHVVEAMKRTMTDHLPDETRDILKPVVDAAVAHSDYKPGAGSQRLLASIRSRARGQNKRMSITADLSGSADDNNLQESQSSTSIQDDSVLANLAARRGGEAHIEQLACVAAYVDLVLLNKNDGIRTINE